MINKGSLEKIYFSIIEWGTYLALFTPLVFFREFFFPFVTPKTIFFRIVVDVIFIAYILLVVSNRKYLPKMSALTASILVFLGIVIITSLLGVNPEKSFWSVFERMTGILTFLHLFVFYIILSSVFKERKQWERILTVSMMVGVFLCFYVWTSNETFARGGGTVGNTSFLAGYLLFDIFFAIIFLFTKKGAWKILYGIMLLILILGIFISQEPCRGAIGSFYIGLLILGLGYLLFRIFTSNRKILKKSVLAILILSITAASVPLLFSSVRVKIFEIWQTYGSSARTVVWNIGFEGWKERFWLGWGQENFNIPFARHFDPALPLSVDVWYDRVHNVVLDTAVTSGALGLISYLAIFGVAVFSLIRLFTKVTDRKNVFFPLGTIVILAAYFIQNLFVFDMISSYMMFFLSLSFANFLILAIKEEKKTDYAVKTNPAYSLIGGILIIVSLLSIYFGNIQPARASNMTVRGISFPLSESVSDFQKAYELSPVSKIEIPEQFSRRIVDLAAQAGQNPSQADKGIIEKGFSLAEEFSKKGIEENPLDFRFRLFLGEYYRNIYQLTQNKESLNLSEETLREAMKLSPKNQQAYWSLGQTLMNQGKNDEAIENFKKAIDLEPRLPQSHWYLFLVCKSLQKNDLALEAFKKADELKYGWKKDPDSLKQVIDLYRKINDIQSSIAVTEEGVKSFPDDSDLWINLVEVYSATGQNEKAKAAAEQLLKLKPELKTQVDEFLKNLGI
ncbi:MAG: tetratricopeptide repeat protein [Candidatus Nealsonbacteria bacterium]|nr:tetratricopeptide repeat protein [Candidatus Nealsonbacteria bacterium]